jgi:uncharacterized protein (DUF1800 family)
MATPAARVAHVWRRLGFGPGPGDVEAWTGPGPEALIAALLAEPPTTEEDWAWPVTGDWTEAGLYVARLVELMAGSPNPLQERLAWILTGLLVVASRDNLDYPLLKEHLGRLRAGALGSYPSLLAAVAASSPMQLYLDGAGSTAEHPNENLGRELCELFALGVTHPLSGAPNYTEADVKAIARALTGYRLDWTTMQVWFDPSRWDPGPKAFLGAPRGAAALAEVVAAIAGHPAFRPFLARRVYRELVGLEPDPATLSTLAGVLGPDGQLLPLVQAIAARPEFLSDAAIGARVKGPIELLAGAVRILGLQDLGRLHVSWALTELQQHPFHAPNVNGWPSGAAWLHAGHLIQWSATARSLAWSDSGEASVPLAHRSPTIRALHAGGTPATGGDLALALAGLVDVSPATRQALQEFAAAGPWDFARACGLMNLALLAPEYLVN